MNASSSGPHLVVDGSKCVGHGICALVMPERISLDVWGYATVDPQDLDSKRLLVRGRQVAHACPAGALTVQVDRTPVVVTTKEPTGGPRPRRFALGRPVVIKNSGEL